MCIPGISEDFLLNVYFGYHNEYLGIIFISTSDDAEMFNRYSEMASGLFKDIESTGMMHHITSWSKAWHDPVDMQEITAAVIRYNDMGQYISYNLAKPRDYDIPDVQLIAKFESLYS